MKIKTLKIISQLTLSVVNKQKTEQKSKIND